LADEGFDVAEEYDGQYKVNANMLYLKPPWKDDFLEYSYELKPKTLILHDPEFDGWMLKLEKSEKPLKKLRRLPRQPKNLQETVEVLLKILPSETLNEIAKMKQDDLNELHFGLGLDIRNGFGLWRSNYALLESCGNKNMHPDEASGVIINKLWEELQQTQHR
jgi:hypothetical protein